MNMLSQYRINHDQVANIACNTVTAESDAHKYSTVIARSMTSAVSFELFFVQVSQTHRY